MDQQAEGGEACGMQSSSMPALEATGLQLKIDGVTWNLKAGAKGSVWLPEEGQDISAEQVQAIKAEATINAGDFVTSLPAARVEPEPTYSDAVPRLESLNGPAVYSPALCPQTGHQSGHWT